MNFTKYFKDYAEADSHYGISTGIAMGVMFGVVFESLLLGILLGILFSGGTSASAATARRKQQK